MMGRVEVRSPGQAGLEKVLGREVLQPAGPWGAAAGRRPHPCGPQPSEGVDVGRHGLREAGGGEGGGDMAVG